MALVRHVAIRCRDLKESCDFYENAIGWKFLDYRPGRRAADMTDGTLNITLIQQPDDWNPGSQEDGEERLHFGVIVDDLEACWTRLQERGAELAAESIKTAGEAVETDPPRRSFKVIDPDGNIVDVTCNKTEWRGVALS